jgi:hypothetical protein
MKEVSGGVSNRVGDSQHNFNVSYYIPHETTPYQPLRIPILQYYQPTHSIHYAHQHTLHPRTHSSPSQSNHPVFSQTSTHNLGSHLRSLKPHMPDHLRVHSTSPRHKSRTSIIPRRTRWEYSGLKIGLLSHLLASGTKLSIFMQRGRWGRGGVCIGELKKTDRRGLEGGFEMRSRGSLRVVGLR